MFDNYVVNLTAGDKAIELGLWDTAGQEEYDRLRPLSYANANVFLICFSVTNPVSYENVQAKWYPEVMHFCPDVPQILVGTKCDTRSDRATLDKLKSQGQKPVTAEEAQALARKIRSVKYIGLFCFWKIIIIIIILIFKKSISENRMQRKDDREPETRIR